jgi:hypothetical protein
MRDCTRVSTVGGGLVKRTESNSRSLELLRTITGGGARRAHARLVFRVAARRGGTSEVLQLQLSDRQ